MRTTQTCRECQGRKLWRVHPVMLPQFDSSNSIYPMPAICRAGSGSAKDHEHSQRQEHGTLEAWICTKCGLTEWYAVNVNQALGALCYNPDSGVTYIDAESPAPYR